MTDWELLRQYARTGSEAAFSELVRRHIDMVYSTCLRRLGNREDAEDAVQAVFIALSEKAKGLGRGTVVGGWLYRAAGFVAAGMARKARRRKEHEMAAVRRQDPEPPPEAAALDVDAVLARLGEGERQAIVLRYLEGRSFEEVAAEMRVTDEAARKRVSRALERMRGMFRAPGGSALSVVMVRQALEKLTQPAPPGLAEATTQAALGGWGAGAGGASLAKGAVLAMALSKAKVIVVGVGLLLVVGGGAVGSYYYETHRRPSVVVVDKPGDVRVNVPGAEQWGSQFYAMYGLKPDEDVKAIVPPMGWERQMFFIDDCRKKGLPGWDLRPEERMVLVWDGSADHWSTIGISPELESALVHAAGLKTYELDQSMPLKLSIPGDWVVRKGTSTDARMAGMQKIVSAKLGRAIRFEKRPAPREVMEVSGTYQAGDRIVEMTDGIAKQPRPNFSQQGSLENFLDILGNRLAVKVENHVVSRNVGVRWRDGAVSQKTMDALLRNLAAQTGLNLSHHSENVEVWCMVDDVPKREGSADAK